MYKNNKVNICKHGSLDASFSSFGRYKKDKRRASEATVVTTQGPLHEPSRLMLKHVAPQYAVWCDSVAVTVQSLLYVEHGRRIHVHGND
jgi:hypothetical protein